MIFRHFKTLFRQEKWLKNFAVVKLCIIFAARNTENK